MTLELSELKLVRKKLGITQNELAKLSGLSQSLIAKIESGRIDPTYSRAKKILETVHKISGKKEMSCGEIMSRKVISVSPTDSARIVIKLMKNHDISQLPVITEEKSVGIISDAILLDTVMNGDAEKKISEIMGDAPPVISPSSPISMLSELLKYYPLVLVSEKGSIRGIITKSDVIQKAYSRQ